MSPTPAELSEFRQHIAAWLVDEAPRPDFLMPQSFMEIGEDRQFEVLRAWQRKVYDAGYLGMSWPEAYGGRGQDQAFQDIVTDEMERLRAPFMMNTIGLNWAGPLMLEYGSETVKSAYIKRILSAEDIWCQGFSEPDHGSDLGNAQLRANRDGDHYVLDGSKIWTTLAPYADYMILLARTDRDAASKYAGLSFFLSPMKAEGITVRRLQKLTGEYGFAQVLFDDARISADCRLGEEGQGWALAVRTLAYERRAEGGQAGGTSSVNHASVADVIALARRSQSDGAPAIEDPLVRDQLVGFAIDELATELAQKRHEIPALRSQPHGIPTMIKLVTSELNLDLGRFATRLLGPDAGYYVGDDLAVDRGLWLRNYMQRFSSTIGGGTSQIQRNILGERVLGLSKD
jgi:alkylation response protein AidB-like acyl-CoA dehydrogenase